MVIRATWEVSMAWREKPLGFTSMLASFTRSLTASTTFLSTLPWTRRASSIVTEAKVAKAAVVAVFELPCGGARGDRWGAGEKVLGLLRAVRWFEMNGMSMPSLVRGSLESDRETLRLKGAKRSEE